MKHLFSPRALALTAALTGAPALVWSAPAVAAKVCENYNGQTTKVAAQIGDRPAPRRPHHPPLGKSGEPSTTPAATPTTEGTPAPHPTCLPKPEKPSGTPKPTTTPTTPTTTPTSSANSS